MGNCLTDKDLTPLEIETKPEAQEKVAQKYNIYEACTKKVTASLFRSPILKSIMIKQSLQNRREDLASLKRSSTK
jgi:hypothetical protein